MRVTKNIILLGIFCLALSGCTINLGSSAGAGKDGAVYVSTNKGDMWQQRANVPSSTGSPRSIASLDTYALAMDPSDSKALYLGTVDNGLYFTYDKTANWQFATSLGQVTVRDIAVDPVNRCLVYAAVANKLYKTEDCARSWNQVYYDNDLTILVNTVAIDQYDSKNVYIGTGRGEVIKSSDYGESWQTVGRFDASVRKVVISPQDSRIVFAGTLKKGVYRSVNSGVDWKELENLSKDFLSSVNFRDIMLSKSDAGVVYLASDYGIFRSSDYGDHWVTVNLITPEKDAVINAIAVSPKKSDEIYYVTYTTFYRSSDGGQNWATKKLPSARSGWRLLVDPDDTNIIYLSVRALEQQNQQKY